jgi:hypothetical protein
MAIRSLIEAAARGATRAPSQPSVDDLIKRGYPESVARRIASGELPMDYASRMQRAADQGYSPVQYHGTRANITEFQPSDKGKMGGGVYTAAYPRQSNMHATPGFNSNRMNTEQIDPSVLNEELLINSGANVLPVVTRGNYANRWDAIKANPELYGPEADRMLTQRLIDQGYDGIDLTGYGSKRAEGDLKERVTFDPNNIRSLLSAAFDPEYTGPNIMGLQGGSQSPSMLGSVASSAVGAASTASDSDEDKLYRGLTDKMVDYLSEQMGGSEEDRKIAEYISMGMDFLPFIGAAKGVSETFDAYKNDDKLGMALGVGGTLAGLIPFGRAAYKGGLGIIEDAPTVTRDTGLLQRVGDPESVNTMKIDVEPGVDLLPARQIRAEDLEGRGFVSGMADTSRGDLSRVVSINDNPVNMVRFGGQDYMRQPSNADRGVLWASDAGAVTGLLNAR